jgi:hypothetical protein
MKDTKTVSITFRTTEELRKKIEDLAKKDNRTLSNMIEVLLEKAVAKK